MTTPRPRRLLIEMGKRYPDAWRLYDQFRQARGTSLPDWPDYVYCPMAAAYAIASGGTDNVLLPEQADAIAHLAALSAWRITQGVYRFDPALYSALIDTPMRGDLPCDLLHHIPEWCVYIETPDIVALGGTRIHGAFVHLEFVPDSARDELRMLLDTEDGLVAIPMHLGPWPLAEAIARALDVSRARAVVHGIALVPGLGAVMREAVEPILALVLYLCSEAPDIDGSPANPEPKRTKKGWRLFPAQAPRVWDVGARIGAAIRHAYQAREMGQEPEIDPDTGRARPRPHMRRAHWHTYWSGPGRSTPVLRWVPPTCINLDYQPLPTVVRPVR